MNTIRYIKKWSPGILFFLVLITACEINEPFPEPNATFTVWGVDPVTNYYEQVSEPYVLYINQSYDFIVEGEGEQFVFWFGEDGDTTSRSPIGSNFADRGVNHLSKGKVVRNGRASFTYDKDTSYHIVMVASSYNYEEDQYKEMLVEKDVEVVPLP